VDPINGLLEVISPVSAGERFAVTVAAADGGGKESLSVLEVR